MSGRHIAREWSSIGLSNLGITIDAGLGYKAAEIRGDMIDSTRDAAHDAATTQHRTLAKSMVDGSIRITSNAHRLLYESCLSLCQIADTDSAIRGRPRAAAKIVGTARHRAGVMTMRRGSHLSDLKIAGSVALAGQYVTGQRAADRCRAANALFSKIEIAQASRPHHAALYTLAAVTSITS